MPTDTLHIQGLATVLRSYEYGVPNVLYIGEDEERNNIADILQDANIDGKMVIITIEVVES